MATVEMLLQGKKRVSFRQVQVTNECRFVELPHGCPCGDCGTESNRDGELRVTLLPGTYQVYVNHTYHDVIRVPDNTSTYPFNALRYFCEPDKQPPAPSAPPPATLDYVRRSGDTMTGDLYFPRTPDSSDSPMMAANKEYVDQQQARSFYVHRQLIPTMYWNFVVPNSTGLMAVAWKLLIEGEEWDSAVWFDPDAEDVRGEIKFGETLSGELRITLGITTP